MKTGKFLMFMSLLSAFIAFVWGVEPSRAQGLSAPGQFKIIERMNPAEGQEAAKQALTMPAAELATAPSIGRTPPTTPRVETNDGLVTLGGTARNAAEKDLATKYAQDVHGVKSVVNNISIE